MEHGDWPLQPPQPPPLGDVVRAGGAVADAEQELAVVEQLVAQSLMNPAEIGPMPITSYNDPKTGYRHLCSLPISRKDPLLMAILLYIVATVLLVLAACNFPSRIGLGWLGMAVFVFTFGILSHIGVH
jgi:hypothetical protein